MPTERPSDQQAKTQHRRDPESPIEAINARIARLAIALGLPLNSDDEVARVMSLPALSAVSPERRGTPDRRVASRTGAGPDRRVAHQREELRGLLVLRSSVTKRYVDDAGVTVTRPIMVEAEERLVRRGFKPGADGVDLDRLFNPP